MPTQFTYLQFHLVFVLPVLAGLAAVAVYRPARRRLTARVGIVLVTLIALLYTTPWDNALIAKGVWAYGDGDVLATVWLAPVEEYVFFLLQPAITGMWLCQLPRREGVSPVPSWRTRAAGVLAGLAVGAVGLVLLRGTDTFYLGALLAWAAPVLAVQWGFGWPHLWRLRRTVALGVAVPTLYLAAADRVALALGVWHISEQYTTGLAVAGLPIEEGAFFLLTNLFVVQGLLLFLWATDYDGPVRRATARFGLRD